MGRVRHGRAARLSPRRPPADPHLAAAPASLRRARSGYRQPVSRPGRAEGAQGRRPSALASVRPQCRSGARDHGRRPEEASGAAAHHAQGEDEAITAAFRRDAPPLPLRGRPGASRRRPPPGGRSRQARNVALRSVPAELLRCRRCSGPAAIDGRRERSGRKGRRRRRGRAQTRATVGQ